MNMIEAVIDDAAEVEGTGSASAPWWSFTKTVLAAAALALVANGRLSLDAPLDGSPVTLRLLLRHRAGIPDYGSLAAYREAVASRETPWTRDELLRRVRADKLTFEPGQGWRYSNVGYMRIVELIENAAGMELGPALDALVFAPLGVPGVVVARQPSDLTVTAWGNAIGYHPGWVYHGLLIGPASSAALPLHRLLAGELLPPAIVSEIMSAYPAGHPGIGRPWRTGGMVWA